MNNPPHTHTHTLSHTPPGIESSSLSPSPSKPHPKTPHTPHTNPTPYSGFSEGLGRPVTLVVGDLSFLHDVNGLNLLRTREARPPLTVVLVNNSGGGIFSFLPIANEVQLDQFNPLWATPQNVDLEGEWEGAGVCVCVCVCV